VEVEEKSIVVCPLFIFPLRQQRHSLNLRSTRPFDIMIIEDIENCITSLSKQRIEKITPTLLASQRNITYIQLILGRMRNFQIKEKV
jgi:putative heme iron utilization protein